jgi:hypothetical protein
MALVVDGQKTMHAQLHQGRQAYGFLRGMPAMKRETDVQLVLDAHLTELRLHFVREYQFCRDRKWRFDYAVRDSLAIEIEGGAWSKGRHTRGKGFIADMEKYNTATMMGWRVLRFTPEQILTGKAKQFIAEWLGK